jgi:prepilin peptidase CpaA
MTLPPRIIQILLVLVVVLAAFFDLRSRRIPNWVSLPGVALGLFLNSFLYGTDGLWYSFKGLALAFAVYFVFYLLRGMGAGDVKLMAAVGAAAGMMNWFGILILTSVVGAFAGIVLVLFKGKLRDTLYNMWFILMSLGRGQAPFQRNPDLDIRSAKAIRLPHGVMIAVGTLGFLLAARIWAPR